MNVTIRDVMQLDIFHKMKLIAGDSGLDNLVTKVGILDYEFTKRGGLYNPAGHWVPGEFVLTSMSYARGDTSMLADAVKKLHAEKTSGIAIKNIYSLEIPVEVKRFANQHRYPVFIFTDNSLYFETVIISVHDFTSMLNNQDLMEHNVIKMLNNDYDDHTVIKMAQEICCAMSTKYSISYFIAKTPLQEKKFNSILAADRKLLGRGNAIIRYGNGFFYIHSEQIDREPNDEMTCLKEIADKAALSLADFHIGVSETQYFIANFKKSLLQSYYAALHCYITGSGVSYYDNIGVYKLLLPYKDSAIYREYYERVIVPLIEYDAKNNAMLLDTVLLYEECKGNINDMAGKLYAHGNTVRYRIRKAAETIGLDEDSGDFHEQLTIAAKLHRIKESDNIFSNF